MEYSVGLYVRLSREDKDKCTMSESILNQKTLLYQYVKENKLSVYECYIDDGYSGTTFDRPAFNKLIKDIESKKINMVITKDMSRLGRDYIETGNLIEKYFPKHNVRYIALTDNIDTFIDTTNNDIAPFKAIMNDMYAKDISNKIKASLLTKMKEGKYVGGRCPYGYMNDPKDKNHLIINEEQAVIVRRIFDMALDGLSYYKIASLLTKNHIKTPASYYKFNWKNNYNRKRSQWHPKTIKDILTNRVYIGDLVQHRRMKVNYKINKIIKVKPIDYIIVENTHDAIIDRIIFYEVEKRLSKNVGRNDKKEFHLLDGLLYCGDCSHRISIQSRRKKDNRCYTICNYYRTYINKKYCTTHSNNYDILETRIIETLKDICIKYINRKNIKTKVLNTINDTKKFSKKEIDVLIDEIKNITNNLDNIYIDKLNKKITEEQFERVKLKLDNELKIKQKRYTDLNNNLLDVRDNESKSKLIEKYIDECLTMKKLSRELIVNLIDKVIIYDNKRIDLKVAFNIE